MQLSDKTERWFFCAAGKLAHPYLTERRCIFILKMVGFNYNMHKNIKIGFFKIYMVDKQYIFNTLIKYFFLKNGKGRTYISKDSRIR